MRTCFLDIQQLRHEFDWHSAEAFTRLALAEESTQRAHAEHGHIQRLVTECNPWHTTMGEALGFDDEAMPGPLDPHDSYNNLFPMLKHGEWAIATHDAELA